MTAIRLFAAATLVALAATTASAIGTKPKPIVDTPCDRHDLGPKFPPIKIPPISLPKPGPVVKSPAVARPVARPK
jgi:hypothetical protein